MLVGLGVRVLRMATGHLHGIAAMVFTLGAGVQVHGKVRTGAAELVGPARWMVP